MKRILKSELDKFYTKVNLAKYLITKVNINDYDLIVDPCCGDGAFFSNITFSNKIGIDILPHIEDVIQHDFLTWDYSSIKYPKSKVLTISNPPFGKQGSLAMDFIKRSFEFSDTIAFILPLSFAKSSIKNRLPDFLHLEYEEILPDNSFLLDGSDYDVKCVFQIWKRKDSKRESIESVKELGFKYTKNKIISNLSVRRVGVYAGKAFHDIDKSEQSHYFLILDDISKLDKLINELNKKTWIDLTVGPRSISKGELNEVINLILA
jgi:predicted RNA methylase